MSIDHTFRLALPTSDKTDPRIYLLLRLPVTILE